MKILLSLLGAVAITSSSAAFVTSNVFVGHKQEQARLIQNDSDIDWKTLEDETTNYFANFKQQQLFSSNNSQSSEMEQAINYAKEKSLSYIKIFSEQNLSLGEIINQISNEFPEFKANYENSINRAAENQSNFSNFYLVNFKSKVILFSSKTSDYPEHLRKVVKNLKISKASFATTAAVAAVAAASFWAASWWFGVTVPWAIACTTASTVCTLIAIGLEKGINIAAPRASDPLLTPGEAYKVGKSLKYGVDNVLKGTMKALKGIKWAFAAVGAVFSIYEAVEDWFDVFS